MASLAVGSCAPSVTGGGPGVRRPQGAAASPTGETSYETLRPSYPGAASYGPDAAAVLGALLRVDPLRASLGDEIRGIARAARQPQPADDPRLHAAADDIARGLRGMDLPPFEVVDFLLGHYGLVEAAPNLLLARASPGADQEVRTQMGEQIAAVFKAGRVVQFGVGVHRTTDYLLVVVALQDKNVDLAPVPRTVAVGSVLTVAGRLLGNHRRPDVIVTGPDGQTREWRIGVDATGVAFRADLRCDRGAGRYQIEVMGNDVMGPAVVANFPVFCGVSPPARPPHSTPVPTGPVTVATAEARVLALVNRDRTAARLPPVAIDGKLSDVARAHSQDMADNDFVGHISPRTGDALDRVRRAGIAPVLLLENVGRAYSADEAQAGLMQSPGHRANILDRRVTRIGIGVVVGKQVTGTTPLLVTQLFM